MGFTLRFIKNDCKFVGCDISDKSLEISQERISKFLISKKDILQPKPLGVEENTFWE